MKMTRWLLMALLSTPGLAWAQDGKPAEDDKDKDKEKDKPAAKAADDAGPKRAINSLEREVQSAQRKVQQAQQELQRAAKQQAEAAKQQAEAARQQAEAARRGTVAANALQGLRGNAPLRVTRSFPSIASARFLAIYGFDLAEADPVLKAQLKLPAEQGLIVTRVNEKGPADRAGLKVNDLILQVDDKDAGKPEQAREALAKVGGGAVQVKLIRAGEPLQLSLAAPEHGIPTPAPTYWIGVNVAPVDATLRSHLTFLPADAGLIATEVIADSPAAKAGLQKSDILAKIDDKPLTNQEAMVALIQKSEGKPVAIELFRAGKPQTLTATPEKRSSSQVFTFSSDRLFKAGGDGPNRITVTVPFDDVSGTAINLDSLRGQLGAELKQLGRLEGRFTAQGDGATDGANARLEKEVKDLSGKIEELEKLIRELAKARPAGKETKD